ncbi:nucleotide exchange factor GrpE [Catellatospora citrea]|uniref:GrpE protein n=1 Tax=Catellatospora citrea TaxID=53366 RepID=A0A8J3NXN6_9ACTN|nr:nucleotide exchange factor GrpE [Catellatospora citrea]RKE11175.1 hypothetical protein C8E86_6099 [Catellatospora citrea]GIF96640.1 hypothetical protein Cci01nite_17340 [Catellatospora citrea]
MPLVGVVSGFAAGVVVGSAIAWHLKEPGPAGRTEPPTAPAAGRPDPSAEPATWPADPGPGPATGRPEQPVATAAPQVGVEDWNRLLEICIDQADRLRDHNPALWRQFNSRLATVGVELLLADGEVFDADRHDATGREATTDPARHLTVASTEFAGYRHAGRYLRRPQVVVYRADLAEAGPAH